MIKTNWNDNELSTPLEDINKWMSVVADCTGIVPTTLVIGQKTYNNLTYIINTVTIKVWSGYLKKRGPDGKEWFVKRQGELTAGRGNKAKKRAALAAYCKLRLIFDDIMEE